jgi:hypothetical protein
MHYKSINTVKLDLVTPSLRFYLVTPSLRFYLVTPPWGVTKPRADCIYLYFYNASLRGRIGGKILGLLN